MPNQTIQRNTWEKDNNNNKINKRKKEKHENTSDNVEKVVQYATNNMPLKKACTVLHHLKAKSR